MICPCCGSKIDKSSLLVDLGSNTVTWHDWTRQGRGRSIELIHVLNEAWPRTVSFMSLAEALWGLGGWSDGWKRTLMTYACRARKTIRPIQIVCVEYVGYKLVFPRKDTI